MNNKETRARLLAEKIHDCYNKKINGTLTGYEKKNCEMLISQFRIPNSVKVKK